MKKDQEKKRQEILQRIKGLRLMDDEFMTKCFEDNVECTELMLQIIMDKDDLKVKSARTQYTLKNLQGRSVRLDILADDSFNQKYNIEVQKSKKGAGFKRARYNSSLMDANAILPGEDVELLPENYVIFITESDLFGMGLSVYHIDRMVEETGLPFGDASHILYVNGTYRGDDPLGRLMHDFSCTKAGDMHYGILSERVRYFKRTEEGVKAMSEAMEELAKKWAEEEVQEEREAVVFRMLETGETDFEKIAKVSKLSVEAVERLVKLQPI